MPAEYSRTGLSISSSSSVKSMISSICAHSEDPPSWRCPGRRVPRDHVAAVHQPADRRGALVAGREGVDRLFAVGRRRAVQLRGDVDRQLVRRA